MVFLLVTALFFAGLSMLGLAIMYFFKEQAPTKIKHTMYQGDLTC